MSILFKFLNDYISIIEYIDSLISQKEILDLRKKHLNNHLQCILQEIEYALIRFDKESFMENVSAKNKIRQEIICTGKKIIKINHQLTIILKIYNES